MKNEEINIVDNIHEFCIKYGFRYDNDKYIKHISNDSKIIIKFEDNNVILTVKFDNLKGEIHSIDSNRILPIDEINSLIYHNSLDIILCKIIIHNINKIYNKILFDNKNNLIYT